MAGIGTFRVALWDKSEIMTFIITAEYFVQYFEQKEHQTVSFSVHCRSSQALPPPHSCIPVGLAKKGPHAALDKSHLGIDKVDKVRVMFKARSFCLKHNGNLFLLQRYRFKC